MPKICAKKDLIDCIWIVSIAFGLCILHVDFFLSEEELGAMEARDFAPEGQHFFKIFGRRSIVRRTFVISLSNFTS